MKLSYNIHESINLKSHRVNIIALTGMHEVRRLTSPFRTLSLSDLKSSKSPANYYSIYSNQYGKQHSQYPKF